MKPVSKKLLLGVLTKIVIMVIIAKALALALLWWLPGEGVNLVKKPSVQPEYQRYIMRNFLKDRPPGAAPKKRAAASSESNAYATISDLTLKGLYGKGETGFAILALKNAQEAEVIGIGESFQGYTLRSIHPQHAVFDRDGQQYSINIEVPKAIPKGDLTVPAQRAEEVVNQGISREQINSYTKNLNKVWKDISLREVKKAGKITGFKVTRIRVGSPLSEIGLEQGDIILKANNKVLDSYAAAVDIYKTIDKLKALELTVLRNNQEKEILYEIH